MSTKDISRAIMGKPQIYFANMGHGEAIAFELNGQWYLRDFGEYSEKSAADRCSVKKLLQQSDQSKCVFQTLLAGKTLWNAIVSHSHRDHISGFEKLFDHILETNSLSKKIFKYSYLPRVCKGNGDKLNYSCLIGGNVLLASFLKNEENRKRSLLFLKSDIIMAALSDYIVYCSSELPVPYPFKTVYCPLRSIAADSYERLFDIQIQINKFYEKYFPNKNEREGLGANVQKIQAILEKYHKAEGRTIPVYPEDAKKDLDSIDHILDENRKYIKDDFKFGKLPRKIKSILDDSSLAFDINLTENSCWLFLGDNNNPVLRGTLHDNAEYDGIKTSHHGTRGASVLNEKNIKSKFLIACAGRENKAFKPISAEYAKKGIVSLGIPPGEDDFKAQGGIIKRIPCLAYGDGISDRCCSELGFPKEMV